MPYVITTKRVVPTDLSRDEVADAGVCSRRAVATLEEARRWYADLFDREGWVCPGPMPGSGVTIVLPDGTVIEVERVPLDWLAAESSCNRFYGDTPEQILAAYNAQAAA